MAIRKPLVVISGALSQLPPNDSVEGALVLSNAVAGSGLAGGGPVADTFRFDVSLAPNASGLIFVNNSLGIDGQALATANTALASGNAALAASSNAVTESDVIGLIFALS